MTEMPNRPLARIIRAADAASWIDGFEFLKCAKAEAAAIRSTADDEISKAREAGREEGRKAGETEAAALLMRTHADVERYLASVEPLIAALAIDIVHKVIGSIDDAVLVTHAAHQALGALREERAVVVNVAPELAQEVQQRLSALGPGTIAIRVAADRHLSGRQCTVTTASTSIDVGIEAQIEAIRQAMAAAGRSDA